MIKFENCKVVRKNIKNSKITINNNSEIIISVPYLSLPSYPKKLFESKKKWIDKKLKEIEIDIDSLCKKGEILHLGNCIDTKNIGENQKKFAKKYLVNRCEELSNIHKFNIGKITIRNQKTRWGSCSSKNNISLNWRLVKCPEKIIDYVILHELVHTIEKNHSKKFWNKLEKYHPQSKLDRKWLKNNSRKLFVD